MKYTSRILLLWITLCLTAAIGAIAGDAVIWGTSGYGRFIPTQGFELSEAANLKQYRNLTVDPSAGAGLAAPIGSIGVRDNGGVGEVWVKIGAANTAWSNALTAGSGWALLGNAGTNDAVNFLGTTDAQDLVIKTNNTNRQVITDTGQFQLTPNEIITSGTIGAVAGSYNSLYMGQTFNGAITNQWYGPFIAPSFQGASMANFQAINVNDAWDATSSVSGGWIGLNMGPNITAGATFGYAQYINLNNTWPAGSLAGTTLNAINYTSILNSNTSGVNSVWVQPQINATTSGYNGYSELSQWGAASSQTTYKAIQIQPTVASGATWTSGVGAFIGPQVASGVSINDYTGVQENSDIDSNMSSYQGVLVNHQGTGDVTNYKEINVTSTTSGNITNYTGISLTPTHSGSVTSATGAYIDMGSIDSPAFKVGLGINQGSLQAGARYHTDELPTNLGTAGFLNLLGGDFTVASGFPVTGGGYMIANNLASTPHFLDDMPVDVTGGLIGYTMVGFVGQVDVAATKTVHHMNMALAGAGVPVASTGGAITTADMYAAAGFLNSGGTVDVTSELRGFHATSNLCSMVSGECFGVKEEAGARNYFLGGVELATSIAQPACTSTIRGTLWVIQGGAGVADQYQLCQKDAADVYSWQTVGSAATGFWALNGNAIGAATSLGSTSNQDIFFITNNTERFRITAAGSLDTTLGTGIVHSDASGILSSSAVDLASADVTGILPMANGGTNKNMTASNGAVVYSDADSQELTAVGTAGQILQSNGAAAPTWVNNTPTLFGTRQTGRSIVAGTGITSGASHMSTTAAKQLIFVVGNGAAPADISASPQIEAGTIVGQEMEICGTDDTAYVLLEQDNNLVINGPAELTKDRCITLAWRGTDGTNSAWGEKGRNF